MWLPIISAFLGTVAFLPLNLYPFGLVFLTPLFIFFLQEKKFWWLVLGAGIFRLIFMFGTVYFTLEPILWSTTLLIFLGLPVSVFLFKKITTWISKKYIPTFLNKNGQFSLPTLIFLPFAWTFFDHLEAHYSFIPAYIMTAGNT